MAKILIDIATIEALISWIPNDGSQSAGLVNEVMTLIASKKPEVVMNFCLAFDATAGGDKEVAQLAGMSGSCVVTLGGWPTEIFVISNVPDEFVGKDIFLNRKKSVTYDAVKVLELAEAEFAKAKK